MRVELATFRALGFGAVALIIAPSLFAGNYYVDPTGSIPGSFQTMSAALSAVPAGTSSNRTNIFIAPGTYTEKLTLTKGFVSFIGMSSNPGDVVLQYNLNATSPNGSGGTVGTAGSTSTTINATDFVAKNITFKNSTPDDIAQAVAIQVTKDRAAFENCRFWGFQDTVYLANGRQYLKNSSITGDTDFIFGNATAVMDQCNINESGAYGFLTAANTAGTTANGFVFMNCTITGTPNTDIDPTTGQRYSTVTQVNNNQSFLGRPWQYGTSSGKFRAASVTYLNSKIGPFIKTDGWNPWDSGNTDPASTTRYAEYNSMDLNGNPLDVSGRVAWSYQLSAAQAANYTLANIFGPASFWTSSNQPHYTGPYDLTDWSTSYVAWDPVGTLASTPVPEPSLPMIGLISLVCLMTRRPRQI